MDTVRSPVESSRSRPVVVRAPRETDAIGGALRGAFCCRVDLPEDMRRALSRLDAARGF